MLDLSTDYLSPAQAAAVIGVTPQRVKQLCKAGRLQYVRTPLGRLLPRVLVEDYAAGRAAARS